MKATEFCYWLQGAFEIADLKDLDAPKVECIREHLRLVEVVHNQGADNSPDQAKQFCGWLDGALDMMDVTIGRGDSMRTARIRERLNAVFVHAVDKSYSNEEQLNQIHHGKTNGYTARC